MTTEEIKGLPFEEGMQLLEETVSKLESGGMTLNDSFEAYETCVMLYQHLSSILDEGDKRIRKLVRLQEIDTEDFEG